MRSNISLIIVVSFFHIFLKPTDNTTFNKPVTELSSVAQLDAPSGIPRGNDRPGKSAQRLPGVADFQPVACVPGVYTAERRQDDRGTATRHQGQPVARVRGGPGGRVRGPDRQKHRRRSHDVQMAAVLAVLVPQRAAGTSEIRFAQFQRVVRVHRRRPAHMRRPTARVLVRVPGRLGPVQCAPVHGRPDQLRRPDHGRLGQTVPDERARRLLPAERRPGRIRVRRRPRPLPAAGRRRRTLRFYQLL